jgi:hypothetical protein
MNPPLNMRPRVLLVSLLFFGTLLHCIPTAEAQINPQVDVTCATEIMSMHVAPGDSRIATTTCTAENPTLYVEEVDLQLTSGVLVSSGPGSLTIAAGESIDFELQFRGDLRMPTGQQEVVLSYVVNTANGVPCPTCTSEEIHMIVVIEQFAAFRVQFDDEWPEMSETGCERFLEIKIYNDGNGQDNFLISIPNRNDLLTAGWSVDLPLNSFYIESLAPPQKVRINIQCPDELYEKGELKGNDAFIRQDEADNGTIKQLFQLLVEVTSEVEANQDGNAEGMTLEIDLTVVEYSSGSSLEALPALNSTLTILSLLGAAAFVNRSDGKSSTEIK